MQVRRAITAVTLVLLSAATAVALPSPAVAADGPCTNTPEVNGVIEDQPWAQAMYDAATRDWPFSTGNGVTVAVLDSGVDPSHFQLSGKVLPGFDFVRGVPEGTVDCIPNGTGIAGIIAAQRVSGIGFYGLAPNATILPVRISEDAHLSPDADPLDPAKLAAGINYAVDSGAQVLNIGPVLYGDDPGVAAAISRAQDAGAVVVAAVGNGHSAERDKFGPTTPALTPFPAAYPGVIGVGAISADGQRVNSSQVGAYVDIVAPGGQVVATGIGGHRLYEGTSIATGFVSASAALLLAQRPSVIEGLSGSARGAAVAAQLFGTASPGLGGIYTERYGYGVVDPYRALTETPTGERPVAVPSQQPPPRDPVAEAAAADRDQRSSTALLLAGVVGALTLVALAAALLVPKGRPRRWRSAVTREQRKEPEDDRPEFLPGEALYETHPAGSRPTGG